MCLILSMWIAPLNQCFCGVWVSVLRPLWEQISRSQQNVRAETRTESRSPVPQASSLTARPSFLFSWKQSHTSGKHKMILLALLSADLRALFSAAQKNAITAVPCIDSTGWAFLCSRLIVEHPLWKSTWLFFIGPPRPEPSESILIPLSTTRGYNVSRCAVSSATQDH